MTALEDVDIARQLGSMDARLENIETILSKLPCSEHSEALIRQNGKNVFYGVIGGFMSALTSVLVLVAIWIIKGK